MTYGIMMLVSLVTLEAMPINLSIGTQQRVISAGVAQN